MAFAAKNAVVVGGIAIAMGIVFIPIYFHPKLYPEKYRESRAAEPAQIAGQHTKKVFFDVS